MKTSLLDMWYAKPKLIISGLDLVYLSLVAETNHTNRAQIWDTD